MMQAVWENLDVQTKITMLNTEGQLYEGVDANDREFPYYSEASQKYYGKENVPIRLHDTGVFYDSFRILVQGVTVEITANPVREGVNLFEKYRDYQILGLTDESKTILLETIAQVVDDYTTKSLDVNRRTSNI